MPVWQELWGIATLHSLGWIFLVGILLLDVYLEYQQDLFTFCIYSVEWNICDIKPPKQNIRGIKSQYLLMFAL